MHSANGEPEHKSGRKRKQIEDDQIEGSLKSGETYAWHFDMLHDKMRLDAFREAFSRLPSSALDGIALDIGCGSGVLGLALLQTCNETCRVVGVEVDSTLATVASENVTLNGRSDKMHICAGRSTTFGSLADLGVHDVDRAKLVVCEILDAGLLGEDCLGTLRHASTNLLSEGYHAVPASAQVFACAVESAALASWQHLNVLNAPAAYLEDEGDANPHDMSFDRLVSAGMLKPLTNEFEALKIDFRCSQLSEASANSLKCPSFSLGASTP